jgi:hypothetical protein
MKPWLKATFVVALAIFQCGCIHQVTFRLVEQARLSGQLVDHTGAGVPRVGLALECNGAQKLLESDYQGRYDYGDIGPGTCKIWVRGDDSKTWRIREVKCTQGSCVVAPLEFIGTTYVLPVTSKDPGQGGRAEGQPR